VKVAVLRKSGVIALEREFMPEATVQLSATESLSVVTDGVSIRSKRLIPAVEMPIGYEADRMYKSATISDAEMEESDESVLPGASNIKKRVTRVSPSKRRRPSGVMQRSRTHLIQRDAAVEEHYPDSGSRRTKEVRVGDALEVLMEERKPVRTVRRTSHATRHTIGAGKPTTNEARRESLRQAGNGWRALPVRDNMQPAPDEFRYKDPKRVPAPLTTSNTLPPWGSKEASVPVTVSEEEALIARNKMLMEEERKRRKISLQALSPFRVAIKAVLAKVQEAGEVPEKSTGPPPAFVKVAQGDSDAGTPLPRRPPLEDVEGEHAPREFNSGSMVLNERSVKIKKLWSDGGAKAGLLSRATHSFATAISSARAAPASVSAQLTSVRRVSALQPPPPKSHRGEATPASSDRGGEGRGTSSTQRRSDGVTTRAPVTGQQGAPSSRSSRLSNLDDGRCTATHAASDSPQVKTSLKHPPELGGVPPAAGPSTTPDVAKPTPPDVAPSDPPDVAPSTLTAPAPSTPPDVALSAPHAPPSTSPPAATTPPRIPAPDSSEAGATTKSGKKDGAVPSVSPGRGGAQGGKQPTALGAMRAAARKISMMAGELDRSGTRVRDVLWNVAQQALAARLDRPIFVANGGKRRGEVDAGMPLISWDRIRKRSPPCIRYQHPITPRQSGQQEPAILVRDASPWSDPHPEEDGGEEGDGAERANLEGIQGVRLMLEKEHAHGGSSTSLATAQSVDEVLAKLLRGLSVDGTLDGKPTDMRGEHIQQLIRIFELMRNMHNRPLELSEQLEKRQWSQMGKQGSPIMSFRGLSGSMLDEAESSPSRPHLFPYFKPSSSTPRSTPVASPGPSSALDASAPASSNTTTPARKQEVDDRSHARRSPQRPMNLTPLQAPHKSSRCSSTSSTMPSTDAIGAGAGQSEAAGRMSRSPHLLTVAMAGDVLSTPPLAPVPSLSFGTMRTGGAQGDAQPGTERPTRSQSVDLGAVSGRTQSTPQSARAEISRGGDWSRRRDRVPDGWTIRRNLRSPKSGFILHECTPQPLIAARSEGPTGAEGRKWVISERVGEVLDRGVQQRIASGRQRGIRDAADASRGVNESEGAQGRLIVQRVPSARRRLAGNFAGDVTTPPPQQLIRTQPAQTKLPSNDLLCEAKAILQ
ncbi:hypothetical protein CYMTET_28245, partial [Cymbomonas tetramitiformis]